MLVYGERERLESPYEKIERIFHGRTRLEMLIETGELAQALLDDGPEWAGEISLEAMLEIARAYAHPNKPVDFRALEVLVARELPESIRVRVPEGFAYDALYPETYLFAAARFGTSHRNIHVIGVRSIGTSLGSVVAVASRAASFTTVRLTGPPSARTLSATPPLASRILSGGKDASYAVVDEGPHPSGSSFDAVADWLESNGARDISFFPSHHRLLGPHVSEKLRARWSAALCVVAPSPVARWLAEDLTGNASHTMEDVGGGRWRRYLFPDKASWPPVVVSRERHKYLVRTGDQRWLLKFAGLGRYGREKLERARVLEAEKVAPKVAGLRRGFLVHEWLEGARPLSIAQDVTKDRVAQVVARYLGVLCTRFPASASEGASPARLLQVARANTAESLGEEIGESLAWWDPVLTLLTRHARYVHTDNRMHAWKWLVTNDGKLLKTDALDHHVDHDLVGSQDIAWDVAGAMVELDLGPDFLEHLARTTGIRPTPLQLAFYGHCYLAFQLGRVSMALHDPKERGLELELGEERQRLSKEQERYREKLRRALTT